MSNTSAGTLPASDGQSQFEIDASGIDFGEVGGGGGGRSQREKVMIGILIAVVLVAGVVFAVKKLHKSGPSPSAVTTITTTSSPSGISSVSPTSPRSTTGVSSGTSSSSGVATATTLAAPFEVYTQRDPFVPEALPISTGDAALFGQTLVVTTTTSPTATTAPTATTSVPSGTSTTSTTAVPPPPQTTHVIELISVYTSDGQPTGNVMVDGTPYTVYDGTTFASNFTVVVLDVTTSCGTFLYADYEFQLCAGQEATV